MKQLYRSMLGMLCLAASCQLEAKRQRLVLTNNSNSRIFACTSLISCKPLSRPAIDPGTHKNLFLPLTADIPHKFNFFLSSNYLDAHYELEYQPEKKKVALLRDGFEVDNMTFSASLGVRTIPLVVASDLSMTFDHTWDDATLQKMPEFPGRTIHLPERRNCTKEPFAQSNQRALAKRQTANDDDLPVDSHDEMS